MFPGNNKTYSNRQIDMMEISPNKENILQVFVVKEDKKDGHFEILSNRELVWKWIEENAFNCLIDVPGKPPVLIKNYKALCRAWSTTHVIPVFMCKSGNTPAPYQLMKIQVRRK